MDRGSQRKHGFDAARPRHGHEGQDGFDADGKITGFDVDLVAEAGAYPAIGAILPMFTQTMIQGVYAIPKLRYHAFAVATNTTPTGAYRGAGRPEATQLLERIIDIAAGEMGMDPVSYTHLRAHETLR